MTSHRLPALLAAASLTLVGCVDHTPSSLVGAMRLTITPEGGTATSLRVDGPPGKLRAQVSDDGSACELWIEVEESGGEEVLRVNTYADQVEDLIAGGAQDLPAVSNADRSIAVNAATVFFTHGDHGYSTAGMLHIDPLPTPPAKLHVVLEAVELTPTDGGPKRTLDGTIDATYVGAALTAPDHERACPALAQVPHGVIF